MLRRIATCLACLGLLIAMTGCGTQAERNAVRGDLRRFRAERGAELAALQRDFKRYAIDQKLRSQELPVDVDRFLEWRRREWWNLTDEMAVAYVYEWDRIEQLTAGVARFYGYEIRNFPRLPEDVCRFFEHTDSEWNLLVRDVTAFVEWQDREMLPLRKDFIAILDRVPWEAGNLEIDVLEFLSWREREAKRLGQEVDQLIYVERQLGRTLREDMRRFRAARALEARYLVADFAGCWRYDLLSMPPRLVDDVWRWAAQPPQDLQRLRRDVTMLGETIPEDAVKLIADLERYGVAQVEVIPALVADVDRFFDVYEREWGPLKADVRRFWRANVGLGIVLRADLRRFFHDHAGEEASELEAGVNRFFTYSRKEWKDFQASVARFFWDDSGRAFGGGLPASRGGGSGQVFDDPRVYPARGYDAGY